MKKIRLLNIVLILALIISQISTASVFAITQSGTVAEELNVLEVQPDRNFELSTSMFNGMANKVNITQMSVGEFNASADTINGKYDIVYMGNKTSPIYANYYQLTNKKIAQLKEYIDSGQLIIYNNNVFYYTGANIYSGLSGIRNTKSFKGTANISTENINNLYTASVIRPVLKINSKPADFDGTNYNESKIMNLSYNLSSTNPMSAKLYFDINGDGLFKTGEKIEENPTVQTGNNYSIGHTLNTSISGMMPYKLEIVDTVTNAKNYIIGYPAYKGDKLNIRVLEITPGDYTNLDLTSSGIVSYLNTANYNISVTKINIDNFNSSPPVLNGNYDMIIFGFADQYNQKDLTDNSVNLIKGFISTGQSVMFTHDVIGAPIGKHFDFAPKLTSAMRAIGTTKSPIGFSSKLTKPGNINKVYWPNPFPKDDLSTWNAFGTTSAKKINDGIVTKFPYPIGDINIASTHDQYWQLDLEDEVVPWYTLNNTTMNPNSKYDALNCYYIFSKDNITYSGAGHSIISPNLNDELKLFINTMLKASRNANHAPTLDVINVDENNIISKSQEAFNFSFVADDIDKDDLSAQIYINDVLVKNYSLGQVKLREPVNAMLSKSELNAYVGNLESFILKIVVKDSKGAIAQEKNNFSLKIMNNPIVELNIDKTQKYLVGDTAILKLRETVQKTSDNLSTVIKNIKNTVSIVNNDSGISSLSDAIWNISDITMNPNPTPSYSDKEYRFNLNKEGIFTINNNLTYTYSNFNIGNMNTNYQYPIAVKTGSLEISVLNNDGSAYKNASVKLVDKDSNIHIYATDEFGKLNVSNINSGNYTLELIDLPSNYLVKGAAVKNFSLSYDNPKSNIIFELIDKNKIGLEIESGAPINCLVGDNVPATLKASAHNEDPLINTVINNIKFKMTQSDDTAITVDSALWNINDITVNGLSITNKDQIKTYNVKINKAGEFSLGAYISYNYLSGLQNAKSTVQKINAKASNVGITVKDVKGIGQLNADVKIYQSGKLITSGKTDSVGTFTAINLPTGTYTTVVAGVSKTFTVSYDAPSVSLAFDGSKKPPVIIQSGTGIIDKSRLKLVDNRVVVGFDATIATEFSTFEALNDFVLTIDNRAYKVDFTLYEVNSDGSLSSAIAGVTTRSVSAANNKTKFYASFNNPKPENHYIIITKIKHTVPARNVLEASVAVNDSNQMQSNIQVIPLPKIQ